MFRQIRPVTDLDESLRQVVAAGVRATPQQHDGQQLVQLTDRAVHDGGRDVAITVDHGHPGWKPTAALPFEPSRGYHATLASTTGGTVLSVKGAPELVLPRCRTWLRSGHWRDLDTGDRRRLWAELDRLTGLGYRVLAVAERCAGGGGGGQPDLDDGDVDGLCFLGFLALADPVRVTARASLDRLRTAGAHIIMITGDRAGRSRGPGRGARRPAGPVRVRLPGVRAAPLREGTPARVCWRCPMTAASSTGDWVSTGVLADRGYDADPATVSPSSSKSPGACPARHRPRLVRLASFRKVLVGYLLAAGPVALTGGEDVAGDNDGGYRPVERTHDREYTNPAEEHYFPRRRKFHLADERHHDMETRPRPVVFRFPVELRPLTGRLPPCPSVVARRCCVFAAMVAPLRRS